MYFWIPEDNLELRVRRDHVPYDVWERQGFLQTTEGNVVHLALQNQSIIKSFCTMVHLFDFLADLCYTNSAGGVKT